MVVTNFALFGRTDKNNLLEYEVTGAGYDPAHGNIKHEGDELNWDK